jgi:phage-related tail protein
MLDRVDPNPRAVIGNNQPPSAIDFAKESTTAVSDWMKDRPVIETDDDARAAKVLVDRAKSSLESMETERDGLVRPLNTQVREINDRYRSPRTLLEKVRNALVDRLTAYARRLEQERLRQAEEARRAAEVAAQAALEAERRAQEAHDDAAQGVCDVDLGQVTQEAEQACSDLGRASRELARAERDSKVRIGGGFGRVMTLRDTEVLTITDVHAAIREIGLTDRIAEVVLTEARAFRKSMGDLPSGISATYERSL